MTEIDARRAAVAASRVVRQRGYSGTNRAGFAFGAKWAVEQLPSRDEIAAISEEHVQCIDWGTEKFEGACFCGWDGEPDEFDYHFADEMLALVRERFEGGS